ncbi:MAG: N-6 DNA methylase [Promethearchaeota archaeon]
MLEKLTDNKNFDLDFHFINVTIKELEKILSKNDIQNELSFKEWVTDFNKIYGDNETNLKLYLGFALVYFVSLVFVEKFILKKNNQLSKQRNLLTKIKKLEDDLISKYPNLNIIEFRYFNPLISLAEKEDLRRFNDLIYKLSKSIFNSFSKPEFVLDYLFQRIISPIFRHKSGEYYTPPFLVKKMVAEAYSFGETVLDPCCGSGNFLVGILKSILSQDVSEKEKIDAINRIYGFDINPISIYLSKINLLSLLSEITSEFKLNLYIIDFLFQTRKDLQSKFDLVIGNPPWYTYRDVETIRLQEHIKALAENLKIKPRPKNLLNLEISTLFFFKAHKSYMKPEAKIFFVITKGVITGSHASRFRNFNGFFDIKVWLFEEKIEKIFNIDFICLYARKLQDQEDKRYYEIPAYHFTLEHDEIDVSYFNNIKLLLNKVETLIPYSSERKANKIYVNKLVPKQKMEDLLPLKQSYYKKLFHKGADLNPRNLIFVQLEIFNEKLVRINPDERIFKKAKKPWDKKEFKEEIIEKKYLFKTLKSTELVKFYIYDEYTVFLPISKSDLSFQYGNLDKNSKKFYDKINRIYLNNKKETTSHDSLMENLNRWSKLINKRQLSKIKVVYNNSGSILNSAIVRGDYLITGDLSFYDTFDISEAYYLSAILNSNVLTEQIKIMKSSRHIFKLPFDIPISKFEPDNIIHQKLAELGRMGRKIAEGLIGRAQKNNENKVTKFKIQKLLMGKIQAILSQIDELFLEDIQNM